MIPEVNFTRSHHFCSIVSDMAPNLQNVTVTCSNCGVLGVNINPCEYCRMLPQCRKWRRRMPGRCFAKSTTANICEVRHVLSVSIVWTFRAYTWTNKLVLQISLCRAELRCEEVALSKAEIKGSIGGCAWRVRIRNSFGRLRLSDVPPSQRRHHTESSLGVCAATWVCDVLIFILNNSFNRAYTWDAVT